MDPKPAPQMLVAQAQPFEPAPTGLLQRAAVNAADVQVPPIVHDVLRSPGQPLDAATRELMEPRFRHDFSHVRIHTDAKAAESAHMVNALAYTVGRDIVFGAKQYAPGTHEGRKLLAHELTHVAQQQASSPGGVDAINQPGDPFEQAANRAALAIDAGRPAAAEARGTTPALQRQTAGLDVTPSLKSPASQQSQGELVVESFLNRMWDAQSKQEQPFRITPGVLDGLNLIFPLGAPIGPLTIYPTPADLMKRLRGQLPQTIDPNVLRVLDRLPDKEKPLSTTAKTAGEPAEPKFPTPGATPGKAFPDPRKAPEKGKGEEEAMQAALKQAFDEFRKTKIGKELEEKVKSYVFSKEGIPLVIFVVGGALTFVAANDPKLPSVPEIPLGEGIKLKFEYSGRISDLPPFLQQLAKRQSDPNPPPGKSEVKASITLTMTFEAIGELAQSVGRFFSKAAKWIANGVVKIGTVIGQAISSIKRELLAMAGGAALGALIGGIAGGPLGAGIGALIGAGVGLIGSLISRLF